MNVTCVITSNIWWGWTPSHDPRLECEILVTTKTMRVEKFVKATGIQRNCMNHGHYKAWRRWFSHDGRCQAHMQIWKSQEVVMTNDHPPSANATNLKSKLYTFDKSLNIFPFFPLYNLQPVVGFHIWSKFCTKEN